MIKIVRDEKDIKKYIIETKRLFDLCKYKKEYKVGNDEISEKFNQIINRINNNIIETNDVLKKEIINSNLLGDLSLSQIADKHNYSTSYIYAVKQKILKEFAMILFEVVLV